MPAGPDGGPAERQLSQDSPLDRWSAAGVADDDRWDQPADSELSSVGRDDLGDPALVAAPAADTVTGAGRAQVVRRGARVLRIAVGQEPRTFAIAVGGSFLYGLMIVVQAYLLGGITAHVVTPALAHRQTDVRALVISSALILVVALAKVTGILGRRLYAGRMQFALQASYRKQVTRRYLALPMSWHAKHPTGELLSNANSDVEAAWYPIAALPFAVGVVAIVLVTIVVLITTNLLLAVIGCLVFPSVIVVNAFYAETMSPRVGESQQLRGQVSSIAHESFDGALVVKTLGREDAETERFATTVTELRDSLIRVGRLRGLFDPLLDAIPNLGILAVLLIGSTRVDAATLVRVAYLFSLLAFPLRAIGWVLAELPRSVVGWDRVERVLLARGEVSYGDARLATGTQIGGAELAVEGVSFAYAGAAPVLHDVSFDLRPGSTVALVGATGSGKSTLASLLLRLVDPGAGRITLDRVDLRALARGQLAESAALVAQHTFVFDDSIRDNVTLGADYDDEAVWAALALAQADGFVGALPDGLDTLVGERGTTLSGGQRQRLSLARALVRHPRLLVLDDATSSVDASVEQAILAGLRRSVAATTFVVAYRKATIALADEVIFLADGRVAGRGSHEQLQATHRGYARIVGAYDRDRSDR